MNPIRSLCALGLLLNCALPAPAQAAPCIADPAGPVAFARVSPLKVYPTRDAAPGAARTRAVRFSRGFPVIAAAPERLELCVDGDAVWVARSHVAEVPRARWAESQYDERADRPENHFWTSALDVERFLSKAAADGTPMQGPPAYREVAVVRPSGSLRLPVIGSDYVEQEIGDKQVQIAQVLVPFASQAVAEYGFIRRRQRASLALVADLSGSTSGLVGDWVRAFAGRLATVAPTCGEVVLFEFGGEGSVRGPLLLGLAELRRHAWLHRAPADAAAPRQPVGQALQEAARRVGQTGAKLPLLVLAGGDIDLKGVDWASFNAVRVVQVTPEREDALAAAAALIPGNAGFIPYARASAEQAANALEDLLAAPGKRPVPAADFTGYIARAVAAGLPPLLPFDAGRAVTLADPPAFADESVDWFALPLWVVRQDDRLRLTDQPP